eukprot:5884006-Pleurochrysis_carterae.AAC.1
MTLMWCDVLDACVARHRPPRTSLVGECALAWSRATRSVIRVPSAAGGVTIASVSPNTQLVDVDCQCWLTESSESENVHAANIAEREVDGCPQGVGRAEGQVSDDRATLGTAIHPGHAVGAGSCVDQVVTMR